MLQLGLLGLLALSAGTATVTVTATLTVSRTATATRTATGTATATRTASVSSTATRTVTATRSTTQTASVTTSGTATATASRSGTATVTVTVSPTGTGTVTATATETLPLTKTVLPTPPPVVRLFRGGGRRWRVVQRLQDVTGQPHMSFGSSIAAAADGGLLAVGAPDGNLAKGTVRIIADSADVGHAEVARLGSPAVQPLDALGQAVSLGETSTGRVVVAGAPGSALTSPRDGHVYVYHHIGAYQPREPGGGLPSRVDSRSRTVGSDGGATAWLLHQRLSLPPEELKLSFGRQVAVSREVMVASSIGRQSAFAERDSVNVVNRKGTWQFMEAFAGVQARFDTVYAYSRRVMRDNVTRFELDQRIRPSQAPVGLDFGFRMSMDSDARFLAVSAPVRTDSLFGHGTDGHLVVTDVTTLDGNGVFNFRSVTVRSGGTLTVTRRDPSTHTGGRLVLRVQEDFIIEQGGVVNVTALGYEGGPASFSDGGASGTARQGESPSGKGQTLAAANGGGGGCGISQFIGFKVCVYDGSAPRLSTEAAAAQPNNSIAEQGEACGGGGGHGTRGGDGTIVECGISGLGGGVYGDPSLDEMEYGAGGGSGHPYKFGSGGSGGWGGGIIDIRARRLYNSGTIEANGGPGQNGGYYSGGGGGGAGGSIRLQGEEFSNGGHIVAKGGSGGQRALGSGSDGTDAVKGGDGGAGRIRIAFVSYVEVSGGIEPEAINDTVYGGNVYVYERLTVDTYVHQNRTFQPVCNCRWVEVAVLRPPGSYFIGHSVATEAGFVAFGTDQLIASAEASRTAVYIYQVNASGEGFEPLQTLYPPDVAGAPTTVRYGYSLVWSNGTLIVSSVGDETYPGVVWLYRPLYMEADGVIPVNPEWILSEWVSAPDPQPGDGFGLSVAHTPGRRHETLYVLSGDSSFSGYPFGTANPTTRGGLYVFQFDYNVSTDTSSVSCVWDSLNVNTTTLCTIDARDVSGRQAGWFADAAQFSVAVSADADVSQVLFVREGVFDFVVRPRSTGSFTVHVSYGGDEIPQGRLTLTASEEIDPYAASLSCNESVEAGDVVVCTIDSHVAGEASAAPHFSATVVNTDQGADHPPFAVLTNLPADMGAVERYVTSEELSAAPHPLDVSSFRQQYYADVLEHSPVTWVRSGTYEFRFLPPLEGVHSVLVKYRRVPLRYPNPFFVRVAAPSVLAEESSVSCGKEQPPNRTSVCAVTLRGATKARSGWQDVLRNLTVEFSTDQGLVFCPHTFVWGGIGRVRLWYVPCDSGSDGLLKLTVYYERVALPSRGSFSGSVAVTEASLTQTCKSIPHVYMGLATLRSEFLSRNDASVFPSQYTVVSSGPRDFCENHRL